MSSLLVADIIKMAEKQLEDAHIHSAKREAEELYCYLKKVDRSRFFLEWSLGATDQTCEQYFDLVSRRCRREPLQHITGSQDFMGFSFKVKPEVLIPRLDSEVVALAAELKLKEIKGNRLLDLCCGSGALGIALAKRNDIKVTAVDISEEAVALTRENAKNLEVKVAALKGDLFQPLSRKKFHMILANPPYIPTGDIQQLEPEVKDHEPKNALDGGEDGLDFYRRIIQESPEYLKKKGILVLEIGADQGHAVTQLLEESGRFEEIQVARDLDGKNRVVTARKNTAKAKGGEGK